MLNLLSGLSPKVIGGLILALVISLGVGGGLFWSLLGAHEKLGELKSRAESAEAQIEQNDAQYRQDRAAWEDSLAARDSALDQARGQVSDLREKLNYAGDNDEALAGCLDTALPPAVIDGLPR